MFAVEIMKNIHIFTFRAGSIRFTQRLDVGNEGKRDEEQLLGFWCHFLSRGRTEGRIFE